MEKMVANNAFMIKEMKEKVEKETRKKYRIEIVKNAMKLGLNDDDISKLTGLGIEEISKIRIKNDVSMEVEYMTLLERDREKIEEGKIEVLKETIMDNLKELGSVPKNLIYSINEQNNIDILKSWNKISVIAKSFDEFQEKIK